VTPDVLYVDDGELLTSAGSAAGIDLCLHLIRRDYGARASNMVARRLVMPPHRDGGQAQFIDAPVPAARESGRLGAVMERMRRRLDADWPISVLAKSAGMSPRTFLRRFKGSTGTTPAKWLLSLRLARARELLEDSGLPIDEIAARAGFGEAGTLRHHFRARLATTPAAYRNAFSGR
jgi:AraC family transcriptional activator FtrA